MLNVFDNLTQYYQPVKQSFALPTTSLYTQAATFKVEPVLRLD